MAMSAGSNSCWTSEAGSDGCRLSGRTLHNGRAATRLRRPREPKDAAIVARAGVMGCSWLEDLATNGLGGRGLNCKGCYLSQGLQDPVTLPEAEEKGLPRLKACHLGNNQDEGDCTGRWRRKRWLVDWRGINAVRRTTPDRLRWTWPIWKALGLRLRALARQTYRRRQQ